MIRWFHFVWDLVKFLSVKWSAHTQLFANKGIRVAPLFVTRIEDSDGNVISTFAPQMEEVISASSTYKMLVMLRAVINEGTVDVFVDMGLPPIWVEKLERPMITRCLVYGIHSFTGIRLLGRRDERDIHFGRMTYGQGAAAALPIWAMYMKKVYDDPTLGYDQQERFKLPEGV